MARALLTISLTISIFLLLIFLVFTVTTAHRISKLPHSQSSDSSDVASFFKAKLVEPPDRSPAELLQDTGQLPGNAPAPTTGVVSSSSWSERAAADDNSGDSSERRGEPPQTTSQLFNRPSAYVEASEVLPSSSSSSAVGGAERFEEEDQIMPEQPPPPPPPPLPKRRIPIISSSSTTTVVYDKLEGEEEEEEMEEENRQQLRAPSSSSNNNRSATAVTATPHHRSRSSAQMKQMEMQDSLAAGGGGGHRPPNEQQQQPRPNMKELLMRYIEQKAAQARAETMNQEGASAAVSSQLNRAKSPPELSPIRASLSSSSSSSRGAPVSISGSSGEIEDDDDDERHSLLFDQQQQQHQSLQPPPPPPVPPQYLPPVVHRNLTSSSQRIAKNFQDLNAAESGGARISRFNLPSTDQNINGANNGNGGSGGGGGKLQCGEAVTIDTNYELSSPNYPDKYPPNMDCSWEITATRQKILRVQIFKLNIEQEQNCRFDYLDIIGVISTDPKTGKVHQKTKRYCGTYVRQEIAIGANRTAITFHSDSSTELAGFHIRVIAESQDCLKAVAVFNSSTLTSPQYPLSYEDSKNCWTVVAAQLPDHRLLVQFEVLRLEPDVKCALDFVELFDGAVAEGGKSLGRFCQLPANASLAVYSSGPRLLVHFQSDNFLALLGYKARITALRRDVDMAGYASCNWSADWANMTISSPFYPKRYPAGTRCETSISALLPTERIIILFDWIDLVDEGALSRRVGGGGGGQNSASSSVTTTYRHNCSADRLEIWESVNDTTPSRVLCGYRSQPLKYVSAGNSIRLVFRSADEDDEDGGGAASTASLQEASAAAAAKNRRRTEAVGISNPGFKARFTFTPSNSIQGSSGAGSGGGQYPPKRHGNGQQQQSHQPLNHHHRLPPPPSSPSSSKTNFNSKPNADDHQQQPPPSPPPLEPVLLRRPENASVRLGSSHVLHCELEQPLRGGGNSNGGQQNPLQAAADRLPIVWFKGDREIHEGVSADGSSLLIRAFRPNSAGRYICVYGDGDHSADAWLTLRPDSEDCRTATSVLFRERPKDQFTSEGEFVMLHCSVTLANADGSEVDTEAKISWERMPLSSSSSSSSVVDGQMVANSSPQPVQYNSRIKVLRRGDLLFDPALSEDSGFYFCVVRPNEEEEEEGGEGRREDKEEVAKEAGTGEQQQPSAPRTSIVAHLSNGTLITTTTVNGDQQQQQKRSRSIASEQQQQQQQQQQPSTTGKTVDCAIKSAARVQINQRVDVSQFCGRSFLQRGQNGGNGQNGGGNGGKPPSMSDVGKIIGGTEAEPGEFPWMVMFWDEKRHVFCGGALLNERWILTAAHCFTDIADESTVFVKLGKYDQTAAEPTEAVTKIAHIIKHPHFSNETFDNDIALVKLVQHITFTDYIAPICLPSSSEEVAAMDAFFFGVVETENGNGKESTVVPVNSGQTDAETKFGYVSGWGRLKENGPLPRYLHKIRLPIVEDDRCHRSTSFKVTENMFCAGYGKEIVGDACKGDSGGPFAVQFANRWTLLGIVSWGEGCGRPEKYGYYTRVNNYSKWIRRLTRHNYQL